MERQALRQPGWPRVPWTLREQPRLGGHLPEEHPWGLELQGPGQCHRAGGRLGAAPTHRHQELPGWALSPAEPLRDPQRPSEPHRAPSCSTEPRKAPQGPAEALRAPSELRTPQSPSDPHRAPLEPRRSPAEPLRDPQSPTEPPLNPTEPSETNGAPQSPTEPQPGSSAPCSPAVPADASQGIEAFTDVCRVGRCSSDPGFGLQVDAEASLLPW